jgi:acyl-CoA reductase-like NAD-dependent aldehyde dehydrogenase
VGRAPLPQIDAAAVDATLGLWDVGLDEGATLISGGSFLEDERRAGDRRVLPTVFTNVEEPMQLARRRAPGPVLALLRVPGDAAGADLLGRIG